MAFRVFLVIGQFGPGGITTALSNRARMFQEAGHDVTILHLGFSPDFERAVEDMQARSRLPSSVPVENPFVTLRHQAESARAPDPVEPRATAGPAGAAFTVTQHTDDDALHDYFDQRGELVQQDALRGTTLVSTTTHNPGTHTSRRLLFSRDGWVQEETNFLAGVDLHRRYTARNGLVYLTSQRHSLESGSRSIRVFDHRAGKVDVFPTTAGWQTAWLSQRVRGQGSRAMVICEGPGVARAVSQLDRQDAARILVVHNNHRLYAERYWYAGKPKAADALVVLTRHQADDIESDFGANKKIRLIPNTLPSADVPAVEREPNRVAMFGSLVRRKGVHDAVAAFGAVVRRQPSAELHIFGEGTQREALRQQITERGLDRHVFLRGYTNEASEEMARASVVLLPSSAEAFGFAAAEALMAATPVIAYDCPYGPRELVRNGVTGFLVPIGDTSGLGEAMVAVLADPRRAREMGRRAREDMLDRYGPATTGRMWEQLFRDLS